MISLHPDRMPSPDDGKEEVWGQEICSILGEIVGDAREVEFYDDEEKLFYVVKVPFPGAQQYLIQNVMKDVSYLVTVEGESTFYISGYDVENSEAERDVRIMSGLYRKIVEDSGEVPVNESVESNKDGKWGMKITGELGEILKGRNEAEFCTSDGEVLFHVREVGIGSGLFTIFNVKTNIAYSIDDEGNVSLPFIKKTEPGKALRKEEVEKDVELMKTLIMKYPGE